MEELQRLPYFRNGELKRQEKRITEEKNQLMDTLRSTAFHGFAHLSYRIEIDLNLVHEQTNLHKVEYKERKEDLPLVAKGHMIIASPSRYSERILSCFSIRDWDFTIEKGAYSLPGSDWRTGDYFLTKLGEGEKDYEAFENKFVIEKDIKLPHPIDYIVLKGVEPVSHQPIYIEMGRIPNPKKPILHQVITETRELIRPIVKPKFFSQKLSPMEKVR